MEHVYSGAYWECGEGVRCETGTKMKWSAIAPFCKFPQKSYIEQRTNFACSDLAAFLGTPTSRRLSKKPTKPKGSSATRTSTSDTPTSISPARQTDRWPSVAFKIAFSELSERPVALASSTKEPRKKASGVASSGTVAMKPHDLSAYTLTPTAALCRPFFLGLGWLTWAASTIYRPPSGASSGKTCGHPGQAEETAFPLGTRGPNCRVLTVRSRPPRGCLISTRGMITACRTKRWAC